MMPCQPAVRLLFHPPVYTSSVGLHHIRATRVCLDRNAQLLGDGWVVHEQSCKGFGSCFVISRTGLTGQFNFNPNARERLEIRVRDCSRSPEFPGKTRVCTGFWNSL